MISKKATQLLSGFYRSGMSFAGVKRISGEQGQVLLVENSVSNPHKIIQFPIRSGPQKAAMIPQGFFTYGRKKNPQSLDPNVNEQAASIAVSVREKLNSSQETQTMGQFLMAENPAARQNLVDPQFLAISPKKSASNGKISLQVLSAIMENPNKVVVPTPLTRNFYSISFVEEKPQKKEVCVTEEGEEIVEEDVEEAVYGEFGQAPVQEMRNKRYEQAKRKRRKRKNGSNNIVRWR